MKFKDIMNETTLIVTQTLSQDRITKYSPLMLKNKDFFSNFHSVIIISNKTENTSDKEMWKWSQLWKNVNDRVYFLYDYINRGWQFGSMDLERMGYSFAKDNISESRWIFKVSEDMYFNENIYDIQLNNGFDFYGIPSIGYATVVEKYKNDFTKPLELFNNKQLNFQTTSYLLSKKFDYLYLNSSDLNRLYQRFLCNENIKEPHMMGVNCEDFMTKTIKRNMYKGDYLINESTFHRLLEMIKPYKIVDPSHKNFLFEECGICHLQNPNDKVIKVGEKK